MPLTPSRSDARRNRQRLVAAAAEAFAECGLEVPPVDIARRAGVGVGTLYRHFPEREALVDAAYGAQLAQLCGQAAGLLQQESTGAAALRAWALRYLAHATAMPGMPETLNVVVASGEESYAPSCSLLRGAMSTLLDAGAADGTLPTEVDRDDVLVALSGIAQAISRYGTAERGERLIDLLLHGLTTPPTRTSPLGTR